MESKLHKILVRGPNWVGDHVMAYPFYRALRQAYPKSHISLLCPERLAGLDGMEFDPLWDEKIAISGSLRKSGWDMWALANRLGREGYSLGISLPSSYSSSLLLFLSRIPNRVGFSEAGSELFLTSWLNYPGRKSKRHKTDLYLDLLQYLIGRSVQREMLRSEPQVREKLILVAPGAGIQLREWPYFKPLLQRLSLEWKDYQIIVVGTEQEHRWHELLVELKLPRVEDYINRLTLPELVQLSKRASLVVANDSGVAHVAATLSSAPTFVLFGPGDPRYIRPLGEKVTIVRLQDLPCSPCESPRCRAPYGYQRCLKDLGLDFVWEKLTEAVA